MSWHPSSEHPALPPMVPGRPAPEFEVQTLHGEPLRLADFRGKYVLLYFWAAWCPGSPEHTSQLRALHDRFAGKGSFVIIGLSLDEDVEAPKRYVEAQGLQWVQAFLGEFANTPVPSSYGLRGVPAFFLVAPDGRILASGLDTQAVQEALTKALGGK